MIECYDKVLKIDPKDVEALNYKGGTLFLLNKNKDAIKYCDKILEIDPKDVEALTF